MYVPNEVGELIEGKRLECAMDFKWLSEAACLAKGIATNYKRISVNHREFKIRTNTFDMGLFYQHLFVNSTGISAKNVSMWLFAHNLVLYEVTYINKDNQRLRKYYYCDFNDAFPVHDKVASYWDRLFDNTKHKSQCLVRLNKDGVVYCVRPS